MRQKKYESIHQRKKYDVVKCRNCGLIFADTTIKALDLRRLYTNNTDYSMMNDSPMEIDNSNLRLDQIEKILKKSKNSLHLRDKFLKKNNKMKIFDYGTGNSNFLYLAKKRGWDAYGFELNREVVKLHSNNNIKMLKYDEIPDEYFDCITFFHVMEHIANPSESLNSSGNSRKEGFLL